MSAVPETAVVADLDLAGVEFSSHGVTLRAGHFLPAPGPAQQALKNAQGLLPCVVMAHGQLKVRHGAAPSHSRSPRRLI
jgi:hypothetical protein